MDLAVHLQYVEPGSTLAVHWTLAVHLQYIGPGSTLAVFGPCSNKYSVHDDLVCQAFCTAVYAHWLYTCAGQVSFVTPRMHFAAVSWHTRHALAVTLDMAVQRQYVGPCSTNAVHDDLVCQALCTAVFAHWLYALGHLCYPTRNFFCRCVVAYTACIGSNIGYGNQNAVHTPGNASCSALDVAHHLCVWRSV